MTTEGGMMMRAFADHSFGARAVSVPCIDCGRMHRLVDSTMDLDGEAFKAYRCEQCAVTFFGVQAKAGAHVDAQAKHERGF